LTENRSRRKGVKPEVATKVLIQLLDDGSCSGRLFVGERLDYLAGPRLRAGQDLRCLVGQGEGELVATGGSRRVISNQ
jgi:hypothetical protein